MFEGEKLLGGILGRNRVKEEMMLILNPIIWCGSVGAKITLFQRTTRGAKVILFQVEIQTSIEQIASTHMISMYIHYSLGSNLGSICSVIVVSLHQAGFQISMLF